jgi:Tol biopolymer transport system component
MSLAAGTRLGSYEITASLGAGGMGEVYRARDTRLQRDVAIKILPALFAGDPERLARFEREAQVLAALNHANIAQIHGVEENAGVLALVMELVDGPTLATVIAERRPANASAALRSGAWDVDRLDIARQLAEALEAAHDRGIIHRDLKPQNIIVRGDGTLKVLDFGLAKALDPISGAERSENSPTITNLGTQVGTMLGTAAYMAPEQVKGRAADRRADIWAFGVVLYEIWTGSMAFGAETVTETLARVIEREPDWSKLPPDTPPAIVRLLQRTLVKDPKRRLQSIGDARLEIEEAMSGTHQAARPATGRPRSWTALLTAAGIAGALVVGAIAGRMTGSAAPAAVQPALRASIALPPGLILDGFGPPEIVLSPDGATLAFLARGTTGFQRLYVRSMASEITIPVPNSETAEAPFFSPDGRWVGFAVGVSSLDNTPPELRKYSLESGLTQTITRVIDNFGSVWLQDGTIVFVNRQPGGLWQVDSAGGEARQIVPNLALAGKEVEHSIAWPSLIPDTRTLVLGDRSIGTGVGELIVVDLDTRRATKLGIPGTGGLVLPNGYLVYASPDAALMAVRFDVVNRRTVGTPVALMPDIAFGRGDSPVFAVASNGTFAFATGYLRYSRREPMQLIRITASGQASMLPFEPDLLYRGFELSPDGSRLAIGAWDGSRWIFDVRRGTRQRLPPGLVRPNALAWHPDGRRLTTSGAIAGSGAWGIVLEPIDGSGTTEKLVEESNNEVYSAGWLPDAKTHVTWRFESGATRILRNDPDQPARTLLHLVESSTRFARVSPNGRWLAYETTSTGPGHVFVMSTDGGGSVQVSARTAEVPRWSHDGKQLFFKSGPSIMAVDVRTTGQQIDFVNERKLFDGEIAREYDVAPNGDFYTMLPAPEIAYQKHIQVRTRWFEEVERVMKGAK